MRALWSKGTKAYDGERVSLPETTCYPRPVGDIPIVVGGNGERRTLRIAATLGDACNLPSAIDTLDRKIAVLHRFCDEVGRDRADVDITVLDIPIVGRDREAVATLVENLRGRTAAATFARTHHAGTVDRAGRPLPAARRARRSDGVRGVARSRRPGAGRDVRPDRRRVRLRSTRKSRFPQHPVPAPDGGRVPACRSRRSCGTSVA